MIMKKITLLIILLVTAFSINAQKKNPSVSKPETYDLKDIITTINNSIAKAEDIIKDDITIQEAEITLQTVFNKAENAELKLLLKASKNWELEKTSTLTFSYAKKDSLQGNFIEQTPIEKSLTDAIVNATKQWRESTDIIKGLVKDKFKIEVSFMAKEKTGGGIEFDVWNIGSFSAGREVERTAVHTIALTFKEKKIPDPKVIKK